MFDKLDKFEKMKEVAEVFKPFTMWIFILAMIIYVCVKLKKTENKNLYLFTKVYLLILPIGLLGCLVKVLELPTISATALYLMLFITECIIAEKQLFLTKKKKKKKK